MRLVPLQSEAKQIGGGFLNFFACVAGNMPWRPDNSGIGLHFPMPKTYEPRRLALPVVSAPKRGRALRPQAEALGLGRSHQKTRCREVAKS
jgi:hypothetical protein